MNKAIVSVVFVIFAGFLLNDVMSFFVHSYDSDASADIGSHQAILSY